jgi:hypothetical protein
MNKLIVLMVAMLLAGCDENPQFAQSRHPDPLSVGQNTRVIVSRIGVFQDNLAYDGKRGIYIIQDLETGTELVGISGVGIAITGSHAAGKSRLKDER